MRALLLVPLLACSSSSSNDITGPFTGAVARFRVDRITVPSTSDETNAFAADLDGNGVAENKLGLVTAVLATTNDLSIHGSDMIASGALHSIVEIQADSLATDDSVGVRYIGASGDAAIAAGGTLVDGVFLSNRTRSTRVPGRAVIRLPVYTNADPLALPLEGLELDLRADGAGGFDGIVRGGIRQADARAIAYAGLAQMFETEPERHLVFHRQVDTDRDGVMSIAELDESVIALLVTADIQLFDGTKYAPQPMPAMKDSLSIAFGIHLAPCTDDACRDPRSPVELCRDRIVDGNESDVDCGGTCQKCFDGLACNAPADCQSNACTNGKCAAASCANGVRDGYESDVDCGSTCGPCTTGRVCAADSDCTSGACDNGVATTGRCT